ncbi:MAG: response regulator [Rickettsiales bacterium]|nr:response regulator [Rickettsiales bacterium]
MPKVMIVEDNELNMKLFRDLLTSETFTVIETQDGKVAYELAKREIPDLILMDIQLQGISGYDIISSMKDDDDLKHVPIIAVTAFAMKDDEERILSSGCDAYISKPISITAFMDTVHKYLSETLTKL